MTSRPLRVRHLLHNLDAGGKERLAVELARRGRAAGRDEGLILFDCEGLRPGDLDPGDVPLTFAPRHPGADLRYGRQLARLLDEQQVDVLHAHNDSALVYGALAGLGRRRSRRPRLVATHHNLPVHGGRAARWLARWAARRADALTCVSAELVRSLARDGWLGDATVVPNGVDTEAFTPDGPGAGLRGRLGVAERTLLVGGVGRLAAVKRPTDLVAACERLVDGGADLALVLLGDGPLRDELEALAAARPWLHLAGVVADMPAHLRDLDVVALSSRHEGQPLAVLEALACGRPVVATRVGGVPELLGEDEPAGPAGRLVPRGDVPALAAALAGLGDPAVRAALGRRARDHALAHHGLDRTAAAYAALYAGD